MTEDFKPVKLPKYWKYTESWCDKNIGEPYDDKPKVNLNKICKSSNALRELTYVLYSDGEDIFNDVKAFNIRLGKVFEKGLENLPADQITSLIFDLQGTGYPLYKDVASKIETKIETYNYELAPDFIKEALLEVVDIARRGCEAFRYYSKLLSDLEKAKGAEDYAREKAEENERLRAINEGSTIELAHVQIKEGFVYVLTNELMPGILKIGFTGRNPDARAKEISSQIGLPSDFVVAGYWRTKDPYIVEQRIHDLLSEFRKPREFFEVSLDVAMQAIEKLVIS